MNNKNPCINCFLEKMSKKNSVCNGKCDAHLDFAITGTWTTRPEPQPVKFREATINNRRLGRKNKAPTILKQLKYKNMGDLIRDFYFKSRGLQDTADKINSKLKGVSITGAFIFYWMKREGIQARPAGGWRK